MRRKRARQDSLELFLDTICNMFGGFVFIMLFVVVSIRMTREANSASEDVGPAVSVADYEDLEIELEELRDRWDVLGEKLNEAKEITDRLVDKRVAEIYGETLEILEELRQVDSENAETSSEIARIDGAYAEERDREKELQERVGALQKEKEEALALAEESRRANARSSTPPQLHKSFKKEVCVVLKYKKLYFWHKPDLGLSSRELNEDDFLIVRKNNGVGGGYVTEPKPWRGVDLKVGCETASAADASGVEARLDEAFARAQTNPVRDRIAILVADDSYEEFSILRDYLKRNRYEIDPTIAKKGTMIFDRGGSGGYGQ